MSPDLPRFTDRAVSEEVKQDICQQCLDRVGSLGLVFALWREARFVRLSVAHKWHLMDSTPIRRSQTLCNRAWSIP